jgi:Skp family chaperone for outer membrane proteins
MHICLEILMVRFPRPVLTAVLLALAAVPAAAQQPGTPATTLRFAWLNSQAIMANTPGRAAAESLFTREMAGFRAEVQRLQQELDSAVAAYNRTSITMTPQARQTREEQLRQQEQRTRQRAQELEDQARQREQELTAPLMQRVNAVIEGVRAEFNYAFIFDVAAQGSPIVTADRGLDITALIIQRLQAAGDAPPPAAADSTRPTTTPAPRPGAPAPTPSRPIRP